MPARTRRMRVLPVEDGPVIQGYGGPSWLDRHRFKIEADGDADFHRYFDEGPIDLVLTDTKHNGISGAEMMATLIERDPMQAVSSLKEPFGREDQLTTIHRFRKA